MTDKVILGLPFINALYHFLVEHDEITTDPFGQKVKFKFASKFEIDTNDTLNLIHAKTKHLNFLRQEVRYKKIVEQLSDKLMQKLLIDDYVPNTFVHSKRHVVTMHYVKWFNTNIFFQGPLMGSFKLLTNIFTGNDHSTKMITITICANILNGSWQEKKYIAEKSIDGISTTNKWIKAIYTTSKWANMTSSTERKNKGKVPAQGYPQDKRLPAGQPFVMHEGASSGKKPSRSTSLQEFVPTEVTYSNGDMVVDLQEVLSRILQFHNGVYSELPNSIKFILDNLQVAFTLKHQTLF